ncbi:L-amino acid N-acyltransferase YncA [Enterobacter sp. BIGb0383]|uniref:GNAT family N-acetyltransferase n=1 Tax=unclassified Enterobacter TaxID=2608935 RepID=UPI000F49AA95|nr:MULTISPECIES: GNAT family N-acetyltransferase [unclassified Enterobacter]ROP60256.1 L-amino acid N-acyltransferase YncA [Enterobacter sp. BIGb0383]ROS08277.1 L-amino acid N-acyltransferase YncA [Enterobacter sp. BIGb0359]
MMTLRDARPEDAPLLSEMGFTSYRHHFAHLWVSPAELATFLSQEYGVDALVHSLAGSTSHWLIAADNERPVGFAKYSCHQPIDPQGPTGTLLHKLYLLPDETGKGYGEEIITGVIQRAKIEGDSWLWLEVLSSNPQARRFYQRQGMVHLKDTLFSTASQQSTLHILGMEI